MQHYANGSTQKGSVVLKKKKKSRLSTWFWVLLVVFALSWFGAGVLLSILYNGVMK